MTNFTRDVKKDLLRGIPEKRCCRLAMFAAFLDTRGYTAGAEGGGNGELSFTSEKEEIAEYFLALAEELFGISMTVTEAVRDPKYGRNKLTFSYTGENAGTFAREIARYGARNVRESDCCVKAYLKGAFLGGGSCTLPSGIGKTGYHLEFVFKREEDAQAFCDLIDCVQLLGNVIVRGEKHVVYFKNRETISDFLYLIGARSAIKKFESVSEERESRNRDNRVNNCFIGNTDKSAIASAEHVMAVRLLEEKGILQTLNDSLRQAADYRVNYPTLSLTELAAMLGVSKSCLNHRMRKLMQIYAQTEKHI